MASPSRGNARCRTVRVELWGLSFIDHGADGTGEPLSFLLGKGNAGSNTAADHITVARAAFAQLPGHRPGKTVLVRTDGAGCTHAFVAWLTGQRVRWSPTPPVCSTSPPGPQACG